jgi:hypothetical protein
VEGTSEGMILTKRTRPLESPGAGTRLAMVSDCDEMELLAKVGAVIVVSYDREKKSGDRN